jgi:diguanylate cyclase (GGDEF)-like protein
MKRCIPPKLIFLLTILIISNHSAQTGEIETPKVLDLRDFAFSDKNIAYLEGPWEFHPQKLKSPYQIGSYPAEKWITLPADMRGYQGSATLRLHLLLPYSENALPLQYGLKIPYFAAASKLWVNGNLLASTGSFTPFIPQYLPREIYFPVTDKETEIVIQVANFHHRRMRLSPIQFGLAEAVQLSTNRNLIRDAIIFGSLILIALHHFLVHLSFRRDRSFLYFAAIAFITALRNGIVHERILVRIFPEMPGELMMKIGYAPVFFLLPLLILYFREIAGKGAFTHLARISQYILLLSSLLILFFPVRVYDWVFQYFIIFIALIAVYALGLFFTGKWFISRIGRNMLMAGGTIIVLAGINDYFREISVIQTPELLSAGILLFLLMQAFFLAWRLEHFHNETARLAGELNRTNEELEEKISLRTRELELANRRLEKLSRIDPLTEIPNRRYFEEIYTGAWKQSERENRTLCLIMLDVDNFKAYNDNYGHPAGDVCLKRLADALQNNLKRGEDFAARFGGEEFIVLLPGHPLDSGVMVAEKLRSAVEDLAMEHGYSETAGVVTISLGIAEKQPGLDQQKLIKLADQALYQAKRGGKNKVVAFQA